MTEKCGFNRGWSKCDEQTPCVHHTNPKCCSCGEDATHECHETYLGFICSALLCDGCEHEITADGTNGNRSQHCTKGQQRYYEWIIQDFIRDEGLQILDSEWWSLPYIDSKRLLRDIEADEENAEAYFSYGAS